MQGIVISELFSLLEQYGVRHIVCSPGSRNAALISGAHMAKKLKKHVVIDERTAAFIALGMALVSRQGVALICTSGTAVLNYAPAIAEAFYQGVPLIIISADRPVEWIDQDDSQTLKQPGVLAHFVKGSYDFDTESYKKDNLWYINRLLNEGLAKAFAGKKGPVHFNFHLSGEVESIDGRIPPARCIRTLTPPLQLSSQEIKSWGDLFAEHKIMLVAGFMPPDHKLQKAVAMFAALPNVCVMAETVSNLHLENESFMVDTVLFPLDKNKAEDLRPDVVITIGGALISRKLKEFLRNYPPRLFNLLFSFSDNLIDCFQSLSYKIECNASSFLLSVAKRMQIAWEKNVLPPYYKMQWCELRKNSLKEISLFPWSDLKALNLVLNSLPASTNLFLSNGTTVRYGQIIPYPLTHATYSNRGVSGIEGCTSTAVGASAIYSGITCLITGDMSFGYDLGGLASQIESENMRVIVMDNGGGDIFRFIKATKNLEIRENYLSTPRNVPVGLLADAYQWIYYYADSEEKLTEILDDFFEYSPRPAILHIDTSFVSDNASILSKYLL